MKFASTPRSFELYICHTVVCAVYLLLVWYTDGENKIDGVSAEGGAMNKRSLKRKQPRKINNPNLENSSPILVKPSCPTKKRVHVPQHPSMETLTRSVNSDNVLREIKTDEPKNISTDSGKKPPLYENGERVLVPFSWLRDEQDAETSTQDSDKYQSTNSPLYIPTFSDLKDSDDEMPSPLTVRAHFIVSYYFR